MESAKGKLINFSNEKNLELIGLLFEPDSLKANTVIIHVHGNFGNFYNNKFIWYMSQTYTESGYAFLTFNLSAHDGLCEGYRLGVLDYIGGGVADYNESILDIDASIKYVRRIGYQNIVLQGHSLGCDKIIEYLIKYHPTDCSTILLSPVDSYAVQNRWLQMHKHETVAAQISRLKKYPEVLDESLEWLRIDEYGAEGLNADWIYKIPITKKALLSILEGSAFQYLNLECGVDFSIEYPTFVFLGLKDGLQMVSQREMRDFLSSHFVNCHFEDTLYADHDIIGVEQTLSSRIVAWLKCRNQERIFK